VKLAHGTKKMSDRRRVSLVGIQRIQGVPVPPRIKKKRSTPDTTDHHDDITTTLMVPGRAYVADQSPSSGPSSPLGPSLDELMQMSLSPYAPSRVNNSQPLKRRRGGRKAELSMSAPATFQPFSAVDDNVIHPGDAHAAEDDQVAELFDMVPVSTRPKAFKSILKHRKMLLTRSLDDARFQTPEPLVLNDYWAFFPVPQKALFRDLLNMSPVEPVEIPPEPEVSVEQLQQLECFQEEFSRLQRERARKLSAIDALEKTQSGAIHGGGPTMQSSSSMQGMHEVHEVHKLKAEVDEMTQQLGILVGFFFNVV